MGFQILDKSSSLSLAGFSTRLDRDVTRKFAAELVGIDCTTVSWR